MTTQLRLFVSALILVLAFSAALPISAFADDGTPPPTEPAAPVDESAPVNADAVPAAPEVNEETPADKAPVADSVEETPAPEETAVREPSVNETDSGLVEQESALLNELPEGTDVVVLNEQGDSVSLASEEGSQILLDGDPIWCPLGVTPIANMGGCSGSYSTFSDLFTLDPIFTSGGGVGPAMNGVIWVRDNYLAADSSGITINGSSLTTMKDFSLAVKGGWTGVTTTINQAAPSAFDVSLTITNWNADVTLSDLVFTGASGSPVLQVSTTKNITVTRVDVIANPAAAQGASLSNSSGTGNVVVTSSDFSSNGSTGGLGISSNGTITLTSVIADSNNGYGAQLSGSGAAKTIAINSSQFNTNNTDGLIVSSLGPITASNLTASDNGQGAAFGTGALLDNTSASPAQNVTLTGINIFLNNLDTGLQVLSAGVISASNLYASSNQTGFGAYLNNSGAATAMAVNLTGSNEFKDNDDQGLRIQSKGAVTLSNITASLNGNDGVEITNTYLGSGANAVTLTGTNVFYNNASRGIEVNSLGPITLSSVTANSNAIGADLNNSTALTPQKVTLSGINTFNDNSAYGLFVNSKGTITVNSITAKNNIANSGAFLYNNYGLDTSMQGITLTGTNVLNGNGAYGLVTGSYGPISVANITANNNLGGDGISLNNGGAATPQSVTVTGINTANGNFYTGLNVYTKGAIKVNSVTANLNGIVSFNGVGASLDNSPVGALGAVTLTGTNVFNGNYYSGLYITSKGAISLANITANANVTSYGAGLSNLGSGVATPQNVTLSGTNTFNGNYYGGLEVSTHGTITANNLNASSNGLVSFDGRGAYLVNNTALTPKAVTLTGTNVFDNNFNPGLEVQSKGTITISNLTASNVSSGNGVLLNNSTATGPQNVLLTGNNRFEDNDDDGLRITSVGAITLNSVTASGNGTDGSGDGVNLRNQGSLAPQNVTITGTNIFNTNGTSGLDVASKGIISLSNTTASFNINGYGVFLENTFGLPASIKGVTLSGTNVSHSNGSAGLYVNSYGPISLNSVTANGNGNQGGVLNNTGATSPQKVTITGTNTFNSNGSNGLAVASLGAITLSNVNASNNITDYGAGVQNHTSVLPQPVTLTGTNMFNGNASFGILILSKGVISANNVTASSNTTGKGADLQNNIGSNTLAQGVKLTGTNVFNSNNGNGLNVISYGAITANNVTANSSVTSDGAYLFNGGSAGPQNVTLTGTNVFTSNSDDGLYVESIGAISVNNITANGNGVTGYGAYLWNNTPFAPQKVSITGTNVFNSNGDSGLIVRSRGTITINNVTASGNTDWGASVENNIGATGLAQGVTLTGTNTFNSNTGQSGLAIISYGPVSINNVTANLNGTYGADIFNDGADNPQKVTLTGINTFNANSSGLSVNTKGAVTSATSLTANDNGITGANFYNLDGVATSGVSLLGTNTFNDNVASDGLLVQTLGAIILNNVTASGNGNGGGDYGAQLNNTFAAPAAPMNVTLTGVNTFSDNYDSGLSVTTEGAISLNSVTANSNSNVPGFYGVVLDNTATEAKTITLTGTNTFNGNGATGLQIWSKGAVTLNNITANGNSTSGADIQNYTAAALQFVKLNGTNVFTGNTDTGLQVTSKGAITANNLTASENLNGGALLDNQEAGATAASTITLTGTHFFNENTGGGVGLRIRSTSTVTLSKLTADDNTNDGVEIETAGAVTFACASITSNGAYGIDVISATSLTLKGVISSGNTSGDLNYVGTLIVVRSC